MNIGKIKVWFERGRMWVGLAQFFMIGYLFISQSESNPLFLILGLGCVLIVLTTFDVKYVLPAENKTLWEYNPAFVDMRNDVGKMKDDIKEIKRKLE